MASSLTRSAQELMPNVDAAELERLLAQWQLEQGRRNRGLWQMALLVLIVNLCIFVGHVMSWSSLVTAAFAFAGLMALIPFGIEAVTLSSNGTSGLFAHLQRTLEEIDDVRAVVPLLDVLNAHSIFDPLPAEFPVVSALTRLLSRMDDATVARYLRPHNDRLYSCLQRIEPAAHPDLVIAALRLLPALNDRPALICAAWFFSQNSPTNNERPVRDAAGTALTSLLASIDLGGPSALPDWIDRLPFGDITLEWDEDWENPLAPLAVLQILPQIVPADYLALNYRCRRRLYASLISQDLHRLQTDYTLAVLYLVQRTGDVEALSVVRQLQMASRRSVREVAALCLPILEAKQEQERIGRTLLRGSGLPLEPAETLLRSVVSSTSDDSLLLLRPTESQM